MMLTQTRRQPRLSLAMIALSALLCAPAAFAAGSTPGTEADIEARYRLDVERCNTGQTHQDKATCLREAGAAREEAQRNRLTHGNEAYAQNQRERCNALPINEREDCLLQMSGASTQTQGSVEGGGVLRQTTITVPAAPATSMGATQGTMPGATAPGITTKPANPPSLPAPALAPNPPPVVPAPSLAPTSQPSPAVVPGTGLAK